MKIKILKDIKYGALGNNLFSKGQILDAKVAMVGKPLRDDARKYKGKTCMIINGFYIGLFKDDDFKTVG